MSKSQELAIQVESINPKKAEQYLTQNTKNRSLRLTRVKAYALQMQRGQWKLIGDPIRFDKDGNLVDGQHRLQAVIMSGKTIKFVVIRNLPEDAFIVMDAGLNRTPGDGLSLIGVGATSHKAAAIRILWVIDAGGDPRKTDDKNAVTRQDVYDYYVQNSPIIEDSTMLGSQMYTHVRGNRSAWITLAVMTGRIDMNLRNKFLEGMRTGANLPPGDPRLALRNWLGNKQNWRVNSAGDHLALYVRAWNDWMTGNKRQTMRLVASDDPFPAIVTTTKEVLL